MALFNNLRFEDDMTSCPIVFMHIPKTGGTSFIEVLNGVYTDVVRGDTNSDIGKKLAARAASSAPNVICGHFNLSASFYKGRIPNYAHVTLLRDPVDRVLSQIYYLKNSPEHEFYDEIKNLSISDIYNSPDSLAIKYGISDLQLHLLSGAGSFTSLPSQKGAKLQRALTNLQNRFSFFGFCERMEDFINLCYKRFGWSVRPEIPWSNCSPPDRNEFVVSSDKELDLIRTNNKYELKLYDWAAQLYKEKYGAILIDLGRAIEAEIPEVEILPEEPVRLSWWKRFKNRFRRALSWRSSGEKDN